MKIDPISRSDYLKPIQPAAAKTQDSNKIKGNDNDEITFSAGARSFSKAINAAKNALAADTDRTKVAEVKTAVEAGTYFVPADTIAESILIGSMQ